MTASPAAGDLADAAAVRDAVLADPDVAGLAAGAFGEVATYFAGRRVPGVRLDADAVEIHVVAVYGRPLPELADALGARLAPLLAGRPLRVVVEDVLLPGETYDPGDTADPGGTDGP